jgi:tight adherence protein B
MSPTAIGVMTVAAAGIGIVVTWILAIDLDLSTRFRVNKRFEKAFFVRHEKGARKGSLFKDLRLIQAETAKTERNIWQRFCGIVEQSGIEVSPRPLLIGALAAGLFAGVVAGLLARSALVALVLAAIVGAAPILYVHHQRQVRLGKMLKQLPGAFEMMSRAVRAGQTMAGAVQLVAEHSKPPLSGEFGLCCEQQNLGLPQDVALKDLARRTGVIELQMFVVAMLVQRQSGGNPVEVLNNLSTMIRKRLRLVGKVKALTGEGRMQAIVLTILPVVAFTALFFLNRDYVQVLLDRPKLLGGLALAQVLGGLWIRRIINFAY